MILVRAFVVETCRLITIPDLSECSYLMTNIRSAPQCRRIQLTLPTTSAMLTVLPARGVLSFFCISLSTSYSRRRRTRTGPVRWCEYLNAAAANLPAGVTTCPWTPTPPGGLGLSIRCNRRKTCAAEIRTLKLVYAMRSAVPRACLKFASVGGFVKSNYTSVMSSRSNAPSNYPQRRKTSSSNHGHRGPRTWTSRIEFMPGPRLFCQGPKHRQHALRSVAACPIFASRCRASRDRPRRRRAYRAESVRQVASDCTQRVVPTRVMSSRTQKSELGDAQSLPKGAEILPS